MFRLALRDPTGGASDWFAEKLEIGDATGNAWTDDQMFDASRNVWNDPRDSLVRFQTTATRSELRIWWPSLKLSDENAYRVRLTLSRFRNLPASETGILRDLPVPRKGVLRTEHRAVTVQGSIVEVSHEIGEGAPHNLDWGGGGTDFALWIRHPAADRVLRVRWPGAPDWQPPSFRAISGCYCVGAPESAVGKRISLEVGLTRTRTFEFIVRPTAPPGAAQPLRAPHRAVGTGASEQ